MSLCFFASDNWLTLLLIPKEKSCLSHSNWFVQNHPIIVWWLFWRLQFQEILLCKQLYYYNMLVRKYMNSINRVSRRNLKVTKSIINVALLICIQTSWRKQINKIICVKVTRQTLSYFSLKCNDNYQGFLMWKSITTTCKQITCTQKLSR